MWGYLVSETKLPTPAMKPDKEVSVTVYDIVQRYRPVGVAGPLGDRTWSVPKPDLVASENKIAAFGGRLFKEVPLPESDALIKLGRFAAEEIPRLFRPLTVDDIPSPESWIEARNRPNSWKEEMRRALDRCDGNVFSLLNQKEMAGVKSHLKDEYYPEFKYPRGINARVDANKILFGPLINAMENIAYANKAFIKHVPVKDRPAYIKSILGTAKWFMCTDYSSFEGSFRRKLMRHLEEVFFNHMISGLPPSLKAAYQRAFSRCAGKKKLVMGEVIGECDGLRMSGEMWTSLHNGISNFIVARFIHNALGIECRGVVEGDDGLFGFELESQIPTSARFAELGFSIKIEVTQNLEEASFCGIVFDPVTETNTCDPREFLASLAWLPYKYSLHKDSKKMALQRAKAMSYLYQYPGCPVIQAAAQAVLRLTRSVNIEWVFEKSGYFNAYEEDMFKGKLQAIAKPVADTTRALMESKFNIDPATQHSIEDFFESWDGHEKYPEYICQLFPREFADYSLRYGSASSSEFVDRLVDSARPKIEDWSLVKWKRGTREKYIGSLNQRRP